jgi:hypothetical protein
VVAAASSPIKSPRFQPHLGGYVENLAGGVRFSRTYSGWWDLQNVMGLHRWLFFLPRLWAGCDLLDPFGAFPFASKNVRLTQGGAAAAARR